jgi:hypothetical protein
MTNRGKATMTPIQRPQSMVDSDGTKVLRSVEASPLARASASTPTSTALPVRVRAWWSVVSRSSCARPCGRRDGWVHEMS